MVRPSRPSRRSSLAIVLSLVPAAFVACGGPPAQPPTTPDPAPLVSAAPVAPAASSVAVKDEPPPAPKDEPPPPPFGGEDPGKTVALTGPRAWVIVSGGVGVYDLVEVKGTKATFKGFGGEGSFTAPSAFTRELVKGVKLKKGDPVLFTVVSSGSCARVVEVRGEKVAITYPWGGQISGREVDPSELLPLDGKLAFGTRVSVQDEADPQQLRFGTLVMADATHAWVSFAMSDDKKVPLKLVKPMQLSALKPGTRVFAQGGPGKIVKVLDNALRYEVAAEGAPKPITVELCELMPLSAVAAPSASAKKKK